MKLRKRKAPKEKYLENIKLGKEIKDCLCKRYDVSWKDEEDWLALESEEKRHFEEKFGEIEDEFDYRKFLDTIVVPKIIKLYRNEYSFDSTSALEKVSQFLNFNQIYGEGAILEFFPSDVELFFEHPRFSHLPSDPIVLKEYCIVLKQLAQVLGKYQVISKTEVQDALDFLATYQAQLFPRKMHTFFKK